jgi:hypothetical protein
MRPMHPICVTVQFRNVLRPDASEAFHNLALMRSSQSLRLPVTLPRNRHIVSATSSGFSCTTYPHVSTERLNASLADLAPPDE